MCQPKLLPGSPVNFALTSSSRGPTIATDHLLCGDVEPLVPFRVVAVDLQLPACHLRGAAVIGLVEEVAVAIGERFRIAGKALLEHVAPGTVIQALRAHDLIQLGTSKVVERPLLPGVTQGMLPVRLDPVASLHLQQCVRLPGEVGGILTGDLDQCLHRPARLPVDERPRRGQADLWLLALEQWRDLSDRTRPPGDLQRHDRGCADMLVWVIHCGREDIDPHRAGARPQRLSGDIRHIGIIEQC